MIIRVIDAVYVNIVLIVYLIPLPHRHTCRYEKFYVRMIYVNDLVRQTPLPSFYFPFFLTFPNIQSFFLSVLFISLNTSSFVSLLSIGNKLRHFW